VMLVELWHCLHNPQKCAPWLFFPGVMGLSQIFEFLMMWQWHCCLHNPQKCVPWLFFLILSHPSFFPPIFCLFNSSAPPPGAGARLLGLVLM